jgi:hypothetical protein
MDADCSIQTGMEEDWRGLYPQVDGERLNMVIIMKNADHQLATAVLNDIF